MVLTHPQIDAKNKDRANRKNKPENQKKRRTKKTKHTPKRRKSGNNPVVVFMFLLFVC
jgi:hypothetical protein